MLKLADGIVELYKKVVSSLPPDVEAALSAAAEREENGSNAAQALRVIMENIREARKTVSPMCQDTGTPIFHVRVPRGISQHEITEAIRVATRNATGIIPLRPNAVDTLTGTNTGDNTGEGIPIVHMEETERDTLVMDLMLKGGGSENIGTTYRLPDEKLGAQRDLEGVKRCIIDAVYRAQGRACPPYIIGVGIGATREQVALLSKRQLLRKLDDTNPVTSLASLEEETLDAVNSLGIGPMGLGGRSTAIGVKIGANHRHPASYFVDVSFGCWAHRRGTLLW